MTYPFPFLATVEANRVYSGLVGAVSGFLLIAPSFVKASDSKCQRTEKWSQFSGSHSAEICSCNLEPVLLEKIAKWFGGFSRQHKDKGEAYRAIPTHEMQTRELSKTGRDEQSSGHHLRVLLSLISLRFDALQSLLTGSSQVAQKCFSPLPYLPVK